MTFRAIRADKTDAGQDVKLVEMDESELMEGDVTVRVAHSTVNYKDGLALTPNGRHPPLYRWCRASTSPAASDPAVRLRAGRRRTDYRLRPRRGASGRLRRPRAVPADWLVKIPAGLTPRSRRWRSARRASPRRSRFTASSRTASAPWVRRLCPAQPAAWAAPPWQCSPELGSPPRRGHGRGRLLPPLGASEISRARGLAARAATIGTERWAGAVDPVGGDHDRRALRATKYGGSVASRG